MTSQTQPPTTIDIIKESDLSDTSRSIHVVTTAALPWLTGTAVNPLLRALYFQRTRTSPDARVTLVIPWVEREDERREVYGTKANFADGRAGREEQEELVRDWAANMAGMEEESKALRIQFYPSTYQKKLGSILPLVDICSLIPFDQADIAILEEPEHLTWLALPRYQKYSTNKTKNDDFMPTSDIGWIQKFKYVVGIVHTNYPAYAKSYGVRGSRTLASKTILGLSMLVCRSYCSKIIKLSATLPVLAKYKECTCNVHGVRADFLRSPTKDEIEQDEEKKDENNDTVSRAYFIGKILWAKGFDYMLHCQEKYYEENGEYFPIDIYGGGPDEEKIKRAFHGVRRPKNQEDLIEPREDIDVGNKDQESSDDDTDEDAPDFQSKLCASIFRSTPSLMEALKEEVEEEEGSDGKENSEIKDDKTSTFETLMDSVKIIKTVPKEKFQFDLSSIPKTRFEWRKKPIPARFVGPKDHAALKFTSHKVFVNPSITEVLCTTSAEALAMGKFVILPIHPSNEFFYQFPNCLAYKDMNEFVSHMNYAMKNDPQPLSPELSYQFTWEAAMERLVESAAFTESEYATLQATGKITRDKRKAWIHQEGGRFMKGDVLKGLIGDPPKENLRHYEIDDDGGNELLTFENSNPKILAFLSFLIAVISYFLQR